MPVIESMLDVNSATFKENREYMLEQIEAFRSIERKMIEQANKAEKKFRERGQLMPRERVEMLLDPGSPFLELSTLAGYQMDPEDPDGGGGGNIMGIGYVQGIRCMVNASNSAYKGGTGGPATGKKAFRMQEIVMQNNLPLVSMTESGGARLTQAADVFVDGGRGFCNQSRMSAKGIPQVTVVHGNATAGGAYQPGLSDYIIMVKGRAKMFLAGPPLLKAATGEVATDEELGGAEMHCSVSGCAEYLAEDDADGIRLARAVMGQIPWNEQVPPRPKRSFKEPLFSAEELLGIVPKDPRMPYDLKEVLARIADGSEFLEFKGLWDAHTVCGHLSVQGHRCGFIGNNGPITHTGSAKAAQFIQLCDQAQIPILFFQNTTGFNVGTEYEQNGIIKHGSKMLQAVANTRVPKITIVVGASYGAGNYAMCGRGLDPRFIFAWPVAHTAVMGGTQAGMVMRIISEAKFARMGVPPDEEMIAKLEKETKDALDAAAGTVYGSARLWDDGIIDPRDTRTLLGFLLDVCWEGDHRNLQPNTFGVGRM
ncbi:MAG: acyl-CoA carboxylase subunit beta [Pseudomonadota bacterium]|nr:acyl-CoA carboxylase subunit beta [Pseudomonadota bacterium]